jgi:hypothetical protein
MFLIGIIVTTTTFLVLTLRLTMAGYADGKNYRSSSTNSTDTGGTPCNS